MFPRGKTRSLSRERLNTLAEQYPQQRQNRKAELVVMVSQLWLTAYQAQESIRLINKDRSLFEYLVDVAEASYITASGKTRQQDLIRAQLELTRLDDRLTALYQNKEQSINQLNQYISDYLTDQYSEFNPDFDRQDIIISPHLPQIGLLEQSFFDASAGIDKNRLYKIFTEHPAVKALQQRIEAEQVGIELARQKYKPAWGMNASYGYRADADNGMNRADLFSVGITFDLPLFTKNRQDQELKAAISSADAIETQKDLILRKMISSFEVDKAQLNRLQQRQKIYSNQLLPQMSEQAEASLTAYTNDDGDFAEVVRARIAELNAQIDALKIDVDIQKTKIKLNYLFMTHPGQIAATKMEQNQ
jgi:outer membrane protein TolC